ncbi:MAG TPA: methyltransferase domain-containing protein [Labilithrix sp.]|jgi:ubiquinone/menaquinone biosynthesis C-methylase UbiE
MGTPWDRAAERYIEEWVPRFVPYHLDLVRELAIASGQRVLVACAGPGAEVLAVARAVGDSGHVRALDPSDDMVAICDAQVKKAGFAQVSCERGGAGDIGDGNWHAIVCAFGLHALSDRKGALERWSNALAPNGKVGVLTFGPPEDSDPFEMLSQALVDLEPDFSARPPRVGADRESMLRMFEEAGLSLVRHTILRHTVSFPSAEAFTQAIREGRTWRRVWDELGPERIGRVTARFFDRVGGPTVPLVFEPGVTLAIAAIPGAEVELADRPRSIRVPALSTVPSAPPLPPEPDK